VDDRPDRQRVDDRSGAHRAAERRARREDRQLDRRADEAHRPAGARHEARHEPVARAGAAPGADVGGAGDAVEPDAGGQHRDRDGQRPRIRHARERRVHRQADDDHVADRAEAGALAHRDPGEQHQRADDDHDRAERQRGALREALMEDVPRVEPEPGADLQRHARAVEHEAGVELGEAADGAIHRVQRIMPSDWHCVP
jgi:hypothetical protein